MAPAAKKKKPTRKELRKQDKLEKKSRKQEHDAKRPRKQEASSSGGGSQHSTTTSRFQFDEDTAVAATSRKRQGTGGDDDDAKQRDDVRAKAENKYLVKKTKLEQELDEDEMEIKMLEQKLGIRKRGDWDRAAKDFRKDGFDDEITRFLRGDDDNEFDRLDKSSKGGGGDGDEDGDEDEESEIEEDDVEEEEDKDDDVKRETASDHDDDNDDEEEEEEEVADPLAHAETTFLPKSGLYGEDAAPLRAKPRGGAKKLAAADDEDEDDVDDELQTRVRSILNRLSSENATQCVKQLVDLFEQGQHAFQHVLRALCRTLVALQAAEDDVLLASSVVVVLDALLKGRNILSSFMEHLVSLMTSSSSSTSKKKKKAGESLAVAAYLANLCALEACFPDICLDMLLLRPDDDGGGGVGGLTEQAALQLVSACGWRMRASDPTKFREAVLALAPEFDEGGAAMLELHGKSKFDYKPREELVRQRKKWMQREVFTRYEHSRLPPALQVRWQDFADAEAKGRWWIQGASWQQQQPGGGAGEGLLQSKKHGSADASNGDALDAVLKRHRDALVPAAIKFGLKTKLKQAVFCSIMSGTDYLDAFTNLMELKLQALEERIMCQVLVKLASETKTFNPFFSLVASQLCTFNSRFKFSFQVVLWDQMKLLSSSSEQQQSASSIANFAKFSAELVAKFSLSLVVFKSVDFARISSKAMLAYLREFFVHLFGGGGEGEGAVPVGREGDLIVAKAFSRLQNVQEESAVRLRDGLLVFFARTEPFLSAKRSTVLGKRVTIAKRVLDHYVRDQQQKQGYDDLF